MVVIPVFAGVGTIAATSPLYREQAIVHASSSLGSLLLSSCYHAFTTELASLSPTDLELIDVDISTFSAPLSLLSFQTSQNAVLSNIFLFLTQSLRYLAYVESITHNDNKTFFSAILQSNAKYSIGIPGFSLGILPACLVASSPTSLSYITHAVEIFKVALWIGIRVQIHRIHNLAEVGAIDPSRPWSLVFTGMCKTRFETILLQFNHKNPDTPLFLTAVLNDDVITISGRPDILAAFAKSFDHASVLVTETLVDGLYHAYPAHTSTRDRVLSDLVRRNIRFPTLSELVVPIISTLTGDVISSPSTLSLIEIVIDMILIRPVNWNFVNTAVAKRLVTHVSEVIELVNMGPGHSFSKDLQRVLSNHKLHVVVQNVCLSSCGQPRFEPIAIVGMALDMPGAQNVEELWDVLSNGINTVSTIPEFRFDVTPWSTSNPGDPHSPQLEAQSGNFISNPAAFDNEFFNISPREARSMDPQQRVLLQVADSALSHAGYVPDATKCFQRNSFGCYVGVATNDYAANLRDEVDLYYSTGTLRSFQSGRISYAMQWSGPSIVVDTACSSSLVAIYQACRALGNRDCNAALAGGVNIITSPDMFIGLDKGHFLSHTGQCKPFDSLADGYSRSEGCGLFVLKRLSDAVAENDRILGVIRGVEVNQSGRASSITRPDVDTQQALFLRLMANAGIDPRRVSVVEAHGTGTQVGDVSEMESIRRVFGSASRKAKNPLHITSVKANIGHLEAASGSASLAKLLLMFRHRAIPRLISVRQLNPLFRSLDADGVVLDREMKPWTLSESGEEEKSRIAVLNNFGAAGSNATLLLEEYDSGCSIQQMNHEIPFVLAISGKTMKAVETLRARYIEFLNTSDANLCDIAYTATARRQVYGCRLAVSGSRTSELVEKLKTTSAVRTQHTSVGNVVFVFSGQGNRYIGMGLQLYKTCPFFRRHIDECQSILVSMDFRGMLDVILGQDGNGSATQTEELETDQIAIFSLEYALSQLWISWGIEPIAVVGHSLGEYAALVTAGVLSLRSALFLVANRARLMTRRCTSDETGMLAVSLDPRTLMKMTSNRSLSIACYNSPSDCVVSGPLDDLNELKEYLDVHLSCKSVLLDVPFGYHSSSMEPILDEITSLARNFVIRPPTISVISSTLGGVILPGDSTAFTADYFARQCRQPVLFTQCIGAYLRNFDPVDVWIEIGPHSSCLPMLKMQSDGGKDARFLPSLRRGQDSWATLTDSLAQLYLCDVSVRWREIFCHVPSASCVDLPAYPFNLVDFWVPYKRERFRDSCIEKIDEYRMIYVRKQSPKWANGRVAIHETPIELLAPFIQGHVVAGQPMCPGSVYHELALASVKLALSIDDSIVILSDIKFTKPLVYDATVPTTLIATTTVIDDQSGVFSICSLRNSCNEIVHCHGRYQTESALQVFDSQVQKLSQEILEVTTSGRQISESFSTRTIYEILFPRVVSYSKGYHTIQKITVGGGGSEGYAIVQFPRDYDKGKFVVHPVFVDTLLHVAGFLSNFQGDIRDACVCSHVDQIKIIPELIDKNAKYEVCCRNQYVPGDGMIVGEVVAVKLGRHKQIVAYLKGVCFRRLRLASLVRALATAAGEYPKTKTNQHGHVHTSKSLSEVSNTILIDYRDEALKIVADVCHLDPLSFGAGSDLAYLGIDSLMTIEISARLQELVPSVNKNQLCESRTVDEIAKVLEASSSASTSPDHVTDHLRLLVTRTVADACGLDPTGVDGDVDLGSVGVDSLMSIEISAKLRKLFPSLDPAVFSINSSCTIAQIIKAIPPISVRRAVARSRQSSTVSIQSKLDDPTVQSLLANVLGLEPMALHADDDLHILRSDSATTIEAIQLLQNEFGVALPQNFFQIARTSAQVESRIEDYKKCAVDTPIALGGAFHFDQPCVSIQVSDCCVDSASLFLIHDGSGLVHYYERLSNLSRNVFAINNPRFCSGDPWPNIPCMASEYAKIIMSECASGPVLLGGWSFGGVVAFEVACQLMQRGGLEVKGVLLIDSPSPIEHVPLTDSLLECAVGPNSGFGGSSEVADLMKDQFRMNSALLGRYQPSKKDSSCPRIAFLRSEEGLILLNSKESVPAWLADRSDAQTAVEGWEGFAGEVKMWDVPGNHFEPFMPTNIKEVSCRMADGCNFLDRAY